MGVTLMKPFAGCSRTEKTERKSFDKNCGGWNFTVFDSSPSSAHKPARTRMISYNNSTRVFIPLPLPLLSSPDRAFLRRRRRGRLLTRISHLANLHRMRKGSRARNIRDLIRMVYNDNLINHFIVSGRAVGAQRRSRVYSPPRIINAPRRGKIRIINYFWSRAVTARSITVIITITVIIIISSLSSSRWSSHHSVLSRSSLSPLSGTTVEIVLTCSASTRTSVVRRSYETSLNRQQSLTPV